MLLLQTPALDRLLAWHLFGGAPNLIRVLFEHNTITILLIRRHNRKNITKDDKINKFSDLYRKYFENRYQPFGLLPKASGLGFGTIPSV